MVYINLLPIREIKRRTRAIQQLTVFAFCLVGVLILIGAVGFYQQTSTKKLTRDIASLKAEKQRYNKILQQIKKLEEDKKLIESKIAVIKQLKKTSGLTVHVLDEIANLTPTKRLWLETVEQKGTTLNLSGMALDNQTIASYMDQLKHSPYIKDVTLIKTDLKQYADRDLKSFQLTCAITIPGSSEEETTAETSPK